LKSIVIWIVEEAKEEQSREQGLYHFLSFAGAKFAG
jgi:hypothetical protein